MKNKAAFAYKLPALFIIFLIWILSSQSSLPVPIIEIHGLDKLAHFVAYTALAAATGLWFSAESWRFKHPRRNFLLCVAVASVYGVVDEFHQYFVPGRDSDVWDWVADTIGGMAGATIILLAVRFIVYDAAGNRRIFKERRFD